MITIRIKNGNTIQCVALKEKDMDIWINLTENIVSVKVDDKKIFVIEPTA